MSTTATLATGWRRLAGATWGPPDDPQFYGELDIDATALLSYLDEVRAVSGGRATVTTWSAGRSPSR
ncbi:hypothetical protein [Actinophytocola sp.]|uniref:hypothetical protein n=1 Tax=Actinophytocola sp. TaxID=1872138 RepID=UPI0025BE1E00|nr:hypothetical protein [Actinophytocola sp.]